MFNAPLQSALIPRYIKPCWDSLEKRSPEYAKSGLKSLDLSGFSDLSIPFETTMVIHSPQTLGMPGMEIYVAKLGLYL